MSGLTSILHIATSGLLAQQTALAATAENIANLTTPDFSRRQVNFSSDVIPNQFSGVNVDVIRAASDQFLQAASTSSASDAAGLTAISDALSRIADGLGNFGDGFSFADQAGEAVEALALLSASPSSTAARNDAINGLRGALTSFERTLSLISGEVDIASSQLEFGVSEANGLLGEIAVLNNQLTNSGGENNGARDALSSRISALSNLLNIEVSRDDIGRATIVTGDGVQLAGPGGFANLQVTGSGQIGVTAVSSNPENATIVNDALSNISGGRIGGNLSLINESLPALANIVRGAATNFVDRLNGAAAGNTSVPASSVLNASLIPSAGSISDLTGTSSFALLNDEGVLLSRIDIDFNTRTLSVDGGTDISFPPTIDGFVSALNAGLSPLGNANLSGGLLSIAANNGAGIAIADDQAGIGALFGFNPLITANGDNFQVNQSIVDQPETFPTARLTLGEATAGARLLTPENNNGAAALFEAGAGQAEQLANALGQIGSAQNAAAGQVAIAERFAEDIEARITAQSGINLEEELSNLLLFQRSFNANARVLSAVDELYQSVLALI